MAQSTMPFEAEPASLGVTVMTHTYVLLGLEVSGDEDCATLQVLDFVVRLQPRDDLSHAAVSFPNVNVLDEKLLRVRVRPGLDDLPDDQRESRPTLCTSRKGTPLVRGGVVLVSVVDDLDDVWRLQPGLGCKNLF